MQLNWFAGLNLGLQILNDAAQLQLLHGGDRKKAIVNDAGQLIQTIAALSPGDPLLGEFAALVSVGGGVWAGGDVTAALEALKALRPHDARWITFVEDVALAVAKLRAVPPVPVLAFPSNLPIHASVAGQSFIGDKYAVRWTADPRQVDEAKAIYDALDVVYHSPSDLSASWYVGPHSEGVAIGDPWKQETYFNGDAIS